jgi:RNA polymerase sigma factor for flagellar operon FliA
MSKETLLLKRYKESPKKLTAAQRDKLISQYAPLIKFVARKISSRLPSHIEIDDLVSRGVMGLLDAFEKYDPSRNNTFKTYAEHRIRGAILDELRALDWVPRSIRDKSKAIDRAQKEIWAERGTSATDDIVAAKLNVTVKKLHKMHRQTQPVSMLSMEESAAFSAEEPRPSRGSPSGYKRFSLSITTRSSTLKRSVRCYVSPKAVSPNFTQRH